MLNKLVGTTLVLAFVAGCGMDSAEDQAAREAAAQAEEIAQEAKNPALREIKAGAQTKKETGVVTWKVFREKKSFRVVGYDKKNKSLFSQRSYSLQYPNDAPGYALHMSKPALAAGFLDASTGYWLELEHGAFMSDATTVKVHKFLAGLERDFVKEATRVGCVADSLKCTISGAACYRTRDELVCFNAVADCSKAVESCEVIEAIRDVGEWIGEQLQKTYEACEENPLVCTGT